jgi:hypothetical protein
MEWQELEDRMMDMPSWHRASYLGLFQGFAFNQGFDNEPRRFRLPNEHFQLDPINLRGDSFSLLDFFTVVAYIDNEGSIFYFKVEEQEITWPYGNKTKETFLHMACTEDDSWNQVCGDNEMPPSEWMTAWGWLEHYVALEAATQE